MHKIYRFVYEIFIVELFLGNYYVLNTISVASEMGEIVKVDIK